MSSPVDPTKAVNFFNVLGKLKTLKRTGWVNNGRIDLRQVIHSFSLTICRLSPRNSPSRKCCRSYVQVWEDDFTLGCSAFNNSLGTARRMAMMSFLITDTSVDKGYLMKICMAHDVAEAVVGDITPYDGVSKEDKRRMEEDALKAILADLDAPEVTKEIFDLWMEYEEGTSKEAQLARELDKFEMIVQADEYEQQQPGKRLDRFFSSTADSFAHPEVLSWANQVRKRHQDRFEESSI